VAAILADEESPEATAAPLGLTTMDRSLQSVLIGTFTLRFSTGLTGAMLQLYLSHFQQFHPDTGAVSALVVGVFAATFYLAELVLSPVFGILSDRLGHHRVMLWGPVFGAVAVILTAISGNLLVLGGTRWLEGGSTAASVPSILGYIAIATAGNEALRGRAASRFEAATLAGIGGGLIAAPTLFGWLGPGAFLLNAVLYGVSLAIYYFGVKDARGEPESIQPEHTSLRRYLELVGHSHVWLLAPTWIAVNGAIGLWFSQSLFQFTNPTSPFRDTQWLLQGFSYNEVTIAGIVVAIVFGLGIFWWGNRFDRWRRTTIIQYGIYGGVALALAGLVVNHAGFEMGSNFLLAAVVIGAVLVVGAGLFILAGATPAAVGLLADVSEKFPRDRGAIMGLYSVFLGVGQIGGALLGGVLAQVRGMDALLIGTGAVLALALIPLSRLRRVEHYLGPGEPSALD
jgi:MFS family permease